jgi:hypothetical protein
VQARAGGTRDALRVVAVSLLLGMPTAAAADCDAMRAATADAWDRFMRESKPRQDTAELEWRDAEARRVQAITTHKQKEASYKAATAERDRLRDQRQTASVKHRLSALSRTIDELARPLSSAAEAERAAAADALAAQRRRDVEKSAYAWAEDLDQALRNRTNIAPYLEAAALARASDDPLFQDALRRTRRFSAACPEPKR